MYALPTLQRHERCRATAVAWAQGSPNALSQDDSPHLQSASPQGSTHLSGVNGVEPQVELLQCQRLLASAIAVAFGLGREDTQRAAHRARRIVHLRRSKKWRASEGHTRNVREKDHEGEN